jgi:hypothetical protein
MPYSLQPSSSSDSSGTPEHLNPALTPEIFYQVILAQIQSSNMIHIESAQEDLNLVNLYLNVTPSGLEADSHPATVLTIDYLRYRPDDIMPSALWLLSAFSDRGYLSYWLLRNKLQLTIEDLREKRELYPGVEASVLSLLFTDHSHYTVRIMNQRHILNKLRYDDLCEMIVMGKNKGKTIARNLIVYTHTAYHEVQKILAKNITMEDLRDNVHGTDRSLLWHIAEKASWLLYEISKREDLVILHSDLLEGEDGNESLLGLLINSRHPFYKTWGVQITQMISMDNLCMTRKNSKKNRPILWDVVAHRAGWFNLFWDKIKDEITLGVLMEFNEPGFPVSDKYRFNWFNENINYIERIKHPSSILWLLASRYNGSCFSYVWNRYKDLITSVDLERHPDKHNQVKSILELIESNPWFDKYNPGLKQEIMQKCHRSELEYILPPGPSCSTSSGIVP